MEKEKINQKMNETFGFIGRIYYEEHKDDSDLEKEYTEYFEKIKDFYGELRKIEDIELAEKGLKRCPTCENKTIIESRFCNMCGHKFMSNDNFMQEEKKAEIVPRKCKACGEILEDDALFCANCGKKQ